MIAERVYGMLANTRVLTNTRLRATVGRHARNILGITKTQHPPEIILSHQWRFVFVGIPKVASTSIKHALRNAEEIEVYSTQDWMHNLLSDNVLKGYFKFSFVRNPWDRVLSVYNDKINGRDPSFTVESFNGLRRGMSFDEFVEWLCFAQEGLDERADRHWLSQHRFVASSQLEILVDYLGYFETLKNDWKKISERIGMPFFSLPFLNVQGNSLCGRDDMSKGYRQYYTCRTKNLIGDRYRQDVELFGYEF